MNVFLFWYIERTLERSTSWNIGPNKLPFAVASALQSVSPNVVIEKGGIATA